MASPLYNKLAENTDALTLLHRLASAYTSSKDLRIRLVEKTIRIAMNDPELVLDEPIDEALHRLLRQVAHQEGLAGTEFPAERCEPFNQVKLDGDTEHDDKND